MGNARCYLLHAIHQMKISIITACRNAGRTIRETIDSVTGQTFADREHIVVDGASTDDTPAILAARSRDVARVVSEPDRGVYDGMNKGIALATGDVVGFLNADDVYAHPRVLSTVAEVMADPAIDACYADLVYVDRDDPDKVRRDWKSCPYRPGLFEKGWMPAHPTFYARRAVYQRFGGFDLAYPRQADFELALRVMAIGGVRTRYVPETWVRMRMGGISNSSFRGILKGNLEAYAACRRHRLDVPPWFILVKMASRLPQFWRARSRRARP